MTSVDGGRGSSERDPGPDPSSPLGYAVWGPSLSAGYRWGWLAVSLIAVVLPVSFGADASVRVFGVLTFGLVLWITGVVKVAVSAIAIIVLLFVLGLSSFDEALSGFSTAPLWLLIGVFVISSAVRRTQLDTHMANRLLRLAGRGRVSILTSIVGLLFLLLFMIPTSGGRVAMVVPVVTGLMKSLGVKRGSAYGKVVFLTIPFVSMVSSTAIVTGAAVAIYTADFLGDATGTHLSWLGWAKAMFPVAIVSAAAVGPIVWRVFRPRRDDGDAADHAPMPAGLNAPQRRLAILLALLVLGFALSDWLDWNIALIILVIAALAVTPGIRVVRWTRALRDVPWDLVLLFGGALALSDALQRIDAFGTVVERIAGPLQSTDPVVVAIVVMVLMAIVRLGITSIVAAAAVTLPLVVALARAVDINPVWLGLVAVLGSDLGLFLPTQSVAGIITYGTGYIETRDMARAAIPVALTLVVVTIIAARFYWPLVGIPIR